MNTKLTIRDRQARVAFLLSTYREDIDRIKPRLQYDSYVNWADNIHSQSSRRPRQLYFVPIANHGDLAVLYYRDHDDKDSGYAIYDEATDDCTGVSDEQLSEMLLPDEEDLRVRLHNIDMMWMWLKRLSGVLAPK